MKTFQNPLDSPHINCYSVIEVNGEETEMTEKEKELLGSLGLSLQVCAAVLEGQETKKYTVTDVPDSLRHMAICLERVASQQKEASV